MADSRHIIARQTLEISVNGVQTSEVHAKAGYVFTSRVLAEIDSVFTAYASHDEHIVIDRLVLDAGRFSADRFEEEFSVRVRKALEEAFMSRHPASSVNAASDFCERPPLPALSPERSFEFEAIRHFKSFNEGEGVRRLSSGQSALEAVMHFFGTGFMPWRVDIIGLEKLLDAAFAEHGAKEALMRVFSEERAARRAAMQLSGGYFLKLVECVNPGSRDEAAMLMRLLLEALKAAVPESANDVEISARVRGLVLSAIVKGAKAAVAAFFCAQTVRMIIARIQAEPRARRAIIKALAPLVKKGGSTFSPLSALLPEVDVFFKNILKNGGDSVFTLLQGNKEEGLNGPLGNKTRNEERADQISALKSGAAFESGVDLERVNLVPSKGTAADIDGDDDGVPAEGLRVFNAGLVLLWPFFERFFTVAGLVKDKEFTSAGAKERAVHLLNFIATASECPAEHMLTLNKALCGISLKEPVLREVYLSENEKGECEKLIFAVISHWGALKGTSVAGFRSSFLERRGVFEHDNGNWLLKAERRAYDMLLDRLPWGISNVKLPWMEKVLCVQW